MTTNGTTKVQVVQAIADMAAPKVTEVNAVTSVDISCYITGDGWNEQISENSITDERLCSPQVFEEPGDFTETLELTYVYSNLDEDNDEARIALTPGTVGYIVSRTGKAASAAFATADIVDVFYFKAGKQRKNQGGRNAKHTMTQKLFLRSVTQHDVSIVAGP
jgi:hypothetical protein